MDDRVQSMIQQLLGRKATDEDRARITKLIGNLPREVLASPAAVVDIVLRADMLAQLDHAIDRIAFNAQQIVHRDLPQRIDQAALLALNKIREHLPVDSKDSVRRLLRMATIWTIIVAAIAMSGGWMLQAWAAARHDSGHRPVSSLSSSAASSPQKGAR